jgi:lactate permease
LNSASQPGRTRPGSLTLSALLASLPLLALLVALGVFKWRAHWAGTAALSISIVIAMGVYHMPMGETLNSGVFGAALSVLAVLWITFNAIWIYNLTVESGHFAVLRRSFAAISDDRRIQSIVIAFSFGALLESLAGGGSPIAICAVMLIAIGFSPLKAATVADFGAMAGRQVSLLAIFVPFVLVGIVDGWKGVREVWPAALTCGLSFGIAQFVFSNFVNYKLCDIFGALVSAIAVILLNKVWQPKQVRVQAPKVIAGGAGEDPAFTRRVGAPGGDSRREVLLAFAPYAVVVILFSLAQLPGIGDALNAPTVTFNWPGLHVLSQAGKPVSVAYKLNWLAATGTLLFVSGVISAIVLRLRRLVRRGGHRDGRRLQRAVRQAAGDGRRAAPRQPDPVRRREHLRWRHDQDDLAAEPGDRYGGGR